MSFLSKASTVSVLQNINSASLHFSTTMAVDQYQPHPSSVSPNTSAHGGVSKYSSVIHFTTNYVILQSYTQAYIFM